MKRSETAYAKINLALHVREQREDGFHNLETCFAFLDVGDDLAMHPADRFRYEEGGYFGGETGPLEANLVVRAARLANGGTLPDAAIFLAKQLPVAAGLGGGSADAAAMLRLMGLEDRHDLAAALGADVPACLASQPVIGRGIGTELSPVTNDVSGLSCILVNPMLPLLTGPVFKAWDGLDRGPMPQGSAREILLGGRNDLEAPAEMLCPVIGEILDWLAQSGALAARMSGSGASCFALYEDADHASATEFQLREYVHQDWWTLLGQLR